MLCKLEDKTSGWQSVKNVQKMMILLVTRKFHRILKRKLDRLILCPMVENGTIRIEIWKIDTSVSKIEETNFYSHGSNLKTENL
jgi:hypothetical protein